MTTNSATKQKKCPKCDRTEFASKDDKFKPPNLPLIDTSNARFVHDFCPTSFFVGSATLSDRFALKILQIRCTEEDVLPYHKDMSATYQWIRDNYDCAGIGAVVTEFRLNEAFDPQKAPAEYCVECFRGLVGAEQRAEEQQQREKRFIDFVAQVDWYSREYRPKPFGLQPTHDDDQFHDRTFRADARVCTVCCHMIAKKDMFAGSPNDPDLVMCRDCFAVYHRKRYERTN